MNNDNSINMKNLKFISAAILTGMLLLPFITTGQEMTALEIIEKADQKNRGITSKGEMTMTIVRPKWERSVSMKSWSMGNDYFMIYITDPVKEKGQVFLKREKEMWNWVPSISRMIKIPPSMMMQSWMGSDFTNDDLVKQSSIVVDYDHTLLGNEDIREQMCFKLELIPKPEAPVVWGKIIIWVTMEGLDLWRSEYYDEDGYLQTTENAYDIKMMDDRMIPTKIEMIPADGEGKKTILEFSNMDFNTPIDENFFTQQNMKKIR
jgi:outer membrane lipoprotein-sorting protein